MEQVAQMLNVKLREEFNIKNRDTKYRLTECGLEYFYEPSKKWMSSAFLNEVLSGAYEIVKIPKPILNEVEKEYLSAVIKPFRNKVKYIAKFCIIREISYENNVKPLECISVEYEDYDGSSHSLEFPYFERGAMYKGMELDKKYNLEALGL